VESQKAPGARKTPSSMLMLILFVCKTAFHSTV